MGSYVTLACCLVMSSCLLAPATSVHKNKIIVKVPHLIKHIHHDHFKPIHVHKVRAKKIDHHYRDDHEENPSSWTHGKKKYKKGNHKLHGSFSNLKPILLHQTIEEHMEYPGDGGEAHEFDHNQRVGHRLEFEQVPRQQFSQEEVLWNLEDKPAKRRPKFREERFNRDETFKRETTRPKHIDFSRWLNEDDRSASGYSSEAWEVPSEGLSHTQTQQRIHTNKEFSNNEHKNKRTKHLNWRSKEESSEIEGDGWKPMVDFNEWKNVNDEEPHHNIYHNKHFIDSGEYFTTLDDHLSHVMEEERTENNRKKKRKENRKKSKTLKTQNENLEQDGNNEQEKQNIPQHLYLIQSPQRPTLSQVQPQFSQPLQTQPIQPYSVPLPQAQPTWPQPHWPAQQSSGSAWQTQTQPTPTPKVVWSGHHLQMPQHSMWHVQQHSDEAPPLQMLTVNQNPLPALEFHQPPSLSHQLTQGSSPVHQLVPPGWPLTRKSQDSSVKQHWEQHVQTSGSDGPASSYRVEVINYTGKKS